MNKDEGFSFKFGGKDSRPNSDVEKVGEKEKEISI